jgi:rSAM/selenodomain-associated transferase 1
MKLSLGVFVKEPLPGQVKTRLTPPLTPGQAAELYRVALHETVERMAQTEYDVVLFYSGEEAYFENNFPQLPRIRQQDGDLGERLIAAFDQLSLYQPVAAAVIGSDSPDLPLHQVDAAFSALLNYDVVTIPASDGGYVLIGSRCPQPQLFENIDWSTDQVLTQTRQRAASEMLRYVEQGGWEDVDDIASLKRLLLRSPESATASYVQQYMSSLTSD